MNTPLNAPKSLVEDMEIRYKTISNYCDLMFPTLNPIIDSFRELFHKQAKKYQHEKQFSTILSNHINSISSLEDQIGVTYEEMYKHMSDINKIGG